MMKKRTKTVMKGFTLIELLVVIAIIAVLAVVVVLTLNPAGLLQEARDSNRISDMATMKSALALYLADVPSPALGSSTFCYLSIANISGMMQPTSTGPIAATGCTAWFPTAPSNVLAVPATYRSVTGTLGWVPVNVTQVSAGAPFALWPIDPSNTSSSYYSYAASTTGNVFKLAMFMESTKYRVSGTADVVSTDGGMDPFVFEGGSSLSL